MAALVAFVPSGKYAQTVFANPNDDTDKNYLTKIYGLYILDNSDKLTSDIILGITQGPTSYQLAVLRECDQDDVHYEVSDQPVVTFIAMDQLGLEMARVYDIKMLDTRELCDEEDLDSLDDQTIGMFITEDDNNIILFVDSSRETLLSSNDDIDAGNKSKSGVKPALDPIQFGNLGVLKDHRSAVDHWVVSLCIPQILRKCNSGKTHYEQFIKETQTWKNVNTYKEIIQIGKTVTGRDMYDDFANNSSLFPEISAQGKSAFKRDWKRKHDIDTAADSSKK